MASLHVVSLTRYPVKGLSPEPLAAADLETDHYFPGDRLYAVENGPSGFDPQAPVHMPKIKFLMLMRQARLATLATRFDHATQVVTIAHEGREMLSADLSSEAGRAALEDFLADFCKGETRGRLRVVAAPREGAGTPFRFTDSRSGFVSIVNQATIADLEQTMGQRVDPLRFRANIVIDGAPAWSEHQWLGRTFAFGTVRIEPTKLVDRCNATKVDPQTGQRDLDVLGTLLRTYGHLDLGLYARITAGGRVAVGDRVAEIA
jgi:uncharacterized protein YcbX